MKVILSLISFSFFLTAIVLPKSAHACSCSPLGANFFETVYLHNSKVASGEYPASLALNVITAEVKKYLQLRPGPYPTEMVLKVDGVLQGSSTTEIIVQGDDGFSCMPYVTNFPIGKKFVFALNKSNSDYYISACGFYAREILNP